MAKHTKACAWWARAVFSREGTVLHENLAEERGGERKHISAAVSRSRTIMGPPQRGQDHVEVEGWWVEQPSSSPGCGSGTAGESAGRPRNWKQSGKRAVRRRWAGKPKWRMRTKPRGKHVEQEAAQELLDRQGHQALLVAVRGVSPAKGDLVALQGD